MPVGAAAAVLAVVAIKWGLWLHREELRTGQQPRTYNRFLLFIVGGGFVIFFLGQRFEFFGDLTATLGGVFISLALVHYAPSLVRSRPAGQPRQSRPPTED